MHRLEDSSYEIDVFEALLERPKKSIDWGFSLHGGEARRPLKIFQIQTGSPADKIGLKPGDEVTEIGDVSTQGLTQDGARDIITQYGLSLILTVERRAQGPVPTNPVANPAATMAQPSRSYQTYDMTGKPTFQQAAPRTYQTVPIQTVVARPYVEQPGQRGVPRQAPEHQVPDYVAPAPQYGPGPDHPHLIPEEDKILLDTQQSRTFRVLQSLMQNDGARRERGAPGISIAPVRCDILRYADDIEYQAPHQSRTFHALRNIVEYEEPMAGTSGLPPLRTASMEKWKQEQQARRENPARVKVFMPATYNTPLNMYSGENILDSFQSQAEAQLKPGPQFPAGLTPAQRAVLEEDHQRQLHMAQCTSDL